MSDKAMKQRHWDRIAETTGHQFDVESETFCLRNIMEAPILKNKDDIEVGTYIFSLLVHFILSAKIMGLLIKQLSSLKIITSVSP